MSEVEMKEVSNNETATVMVNDSPKETYEKGNNEEKNLQDVTSMSKKVEDEVKSVEQDGTMNSVQFAINIMKGIAGTGSLAVPNAIMSVGIIWGLVLFFLVALLYIYSSYILVTIQNTLGARKNIGNGIIHTQNDYARICYIALGKPGYYIFNFAMLMTLYGAAIGTMIVMTDFLASLPFLTNNVSTKRYLMQIILTILAIILCLLKDPSLLVTISSFGLFALVISFILLFIYGITQSKFSFKSAYLFPTSTSDFFNKFGILVYSLGFTLFLLSQLKHVKKAYRSQITKTISVSVVLMAIIYGIVGIVFFLLFAASPTGVPGNILNALPSNSFYNIIVSILMVVTCIGGFPLYMGPAHEVVEGDWGEMTSNRFFITNKKYILFRVVEIIFISFVAALVPSFSDILGFNILYVFECV